MIDNDVMVAEQAITDPHTVPAFIRGQVARMHADMARMRGAAEKLIKEWNNFLNSAPADQLRPAEFYLLAPMEWLSDALAGTSAPLTMYDDSTPVLAALKLIAENGHQTDAIRLVARQAIAEIERLSPGTSAPPSDPCADAQHPDFEAGE